jgi:hypothetical protein
MDQRGEKFEDWIGEKWLTLIDRPDDKPTYFSKKCRKSSTHDLASATVDIQKLTTRSVCQQLGGSDH